MTETLYKFGSFDAMSLFDDVPYQHPHLWQIEQTTAQPRLVLAPRSDQIALLRALSRRLPEPYYVLYMLVTARGESQEGRYQTTEPLFREDLEHFLESFQAFFERDGRHHLWIGSVYSSELLVYDNHNIIYAYGPLPTYQAVAREFGLGEGELVMPYPHTHHYHAEFDASVPQLLNFTAWTHFPLQEGDDD